MSRILPAISASMTLVACMLSMLSGSVLAQAPPVPEADRKLVYFDEPVGLPSFHKTSVYRAWNDSESFFLLPTGIERRKGDIAVQYQTSGGKLTGNLTLTVESAFDKEEFEKIVAELKTKVPSGKFSVVEPVSSEWEILGFGTARTVTPILMSNPLLSPVSVSIELPEQLLRVLLHEGSQYADAFVIRHKFAVRGFELDVNMKPRLTTRWFSRGASFTGNCKDDPGLFFDVRTGQTGCVTKMRYAAEVVDEAQALLRSLGYYKQKPDGVIGRRTREAIRAFQRDERQVPDGEFTFKLLEQLRAKGSQGKA